MKSDFEIILSTNRTASISVYLQRVNYRVEFSQCVCKFHNSSLNIWGQIQQMNIITHSYCEKKQPPNNIQQN